MARDQKRMTTTGHRRGECAPVDLESFAERSAQQSGQQFLNSSDPRLTRQSAFGKTAGGEASASLPVGQCSFTGKPEASDGGAAVRPTAGKDTKLFRGLGQSPIDAEGGVPSSLVSLENNCNSEGQGTTAAQQEAADRKRAAVKRWKRRVAGRRDDGRPCLCGAYTLEGVSLIDGRRRYSRVDCKTWGCPRCGQRRAKHYRRAIRDAAVSNGLSRFLTLTLDPKKVEGDPIKYLRETFSKFRVYLGRRFKRAPKYIAVVELHKNGMPHLHVLIDRYIEQAWIKNAWQSIGGGCMVDIRYTDVHRIAHYVAKYLTKEMLLSAPAGTRRITCSQQIRLNAKPEKTATWSLLRTNVQNLYEFLKAYADAPTYDEEGVLTCFIVRASGGAS